MWFEFPPAFAIALFGSGLIAQVQAQAIGYDRCEYFGQDPLQCQYCPYYGGSQPLLCWAFNSTFDDLSEGDNQLKNYQTMKFAKFTVASQGAEGTGILLRPKSRPQFGRIDAGKAGTISFGAGEDPEVEDWYGDPAPFFRVGSLISFYSGCTLPSNVETAIPCDITIDAFCFARFPSHYHPQRAKLRRTNVTYVPTKASQKSADSKMQYVNFGDQGESVGHQGPYCYNFTFSATTTSKIIKPILYLDEIITTSIYGRYGYTYYE